MSSHKRLHETKRTARYFAKKYIRRGWPPIPVPVGSKKPNDRKGWQDERRTLDDLDDFDGNPNVGVLLGAPSGGLIDIDLDCAEAIALADRFLPATGAIFGRPARARSHRLYVVAEPIETHKLRDVGDAERKKPCTLLEVRSTGCQTIVPPSVVDGERRTWDPGPKPGKPAEVAAEELMGAVHRLAAAALLVRHYPAEGSRNEWAMAMAGTLLRGKWTSPETEHLIRSVAYAAGDEEAADRPKVVSHTAQKLAQNAPVTGFKTLEELLGAGVTAKLASFLPEVRPSPSETAPVPSDKPAQAGDRYLTETWLAERVIEQHGVDLRYVGPWLRWLSWDGTRWIVDETGEIQRRVKDTIRALHAKAATEKDDELATFCVKAESAARRTSVASLARYERAVVLHHEQLEKEPWLLNVLNGTLDLRTGILRPNRREDLLTKRLNVAYDSKATCPIWDGFLDYIMSSNRSLIDFLRRGAGYSLTGSVMEQVIFFLFGTGANGKSTFTGTLQAMLGEYAIQAAPGLLIAKRNESHPAEQADLFRVRLAVSQEVEQGRSVAEAALKQMTGGDRIRARKMRENFWEFDPTHKLWLGANHKPPIRGTDWGIWRRILLVPFSVTIPEAKRDRSLPDKLKAELPGILAWAVRGCLEWQKDGLNAPKEVRIATAKYREEMDVLGDFFAQRCVMDKAARTSAEKLYGSFKAWANERGEPEISQKVLGAELANRGLQNKKSGGRIVWAGICLKEDGEDGEDDQAIGPGAGGEDDDRRSPILRESVGSDSKEKGGKVLHPPHSPSGSGEGEASKPKPHQHKSKKHQHSHHSSSGSEEPRKGSHRHQKKKHKHRKTGSEE